MVAGLSSLAVSGEDIEGDDGQDHLRSAINRRNISTRASYYVNLRNAFTRAKNEAHGRERSMNPFDLAQRIYETEACEATFFDTWAFYMDSGYVISTPSFFAMFRAVSSVAPEREIVGAKVFDLAAMDCWHFHVVAGDMSQLYNFADRDYPFASFEKRNRLRILVKCDILRIIKNSNYIK